MFLRAPRALLRGALTLALAAAATVAGSAVAQAAAPQLALSALTWEQSSVDVTTDYAANKLTWTVTNSDPAADSVHGTVTMRMRSSVTGALVGHDWVARYEYGQTCCSDAEYVSGTPQESTYQFYLPVRRYSDAATTTWEVTKVTMESDDASTAVSGARLQSFGYAFSARTLIDSSGPTVDSISLGGSRKPYLYVGDRSATASFDFTVQDGQSGFWKGKIKLAGPGGQSITTSFTWEREDYSTGFRCGSVSGGDRDGTYMPCSIGVTLPAGAAAGSWRVASLVLQNNAGGQTTSKNPTAPSITVTSNAAVRADDFTISPNPVDNWRDSAKTDLSMSVTGARKGVSAVRVDFEYGGCYASDDPIVKDGRIAVAVTMYRQTERCRVEGIAVVDGSGAVALYGPAYAAPDPGLTVNRLPSTTAPVVLGASLDPVTLTQSEASYRSPTLTIRAAVQTAPVDGISVYLYDADGEVASQSFGGTSQAEDGTVTNWVYLPWDIKPGRYTVGFGLDDAAGLSSYWDMPDRSDSRALPGGPLVLTITED
ncbi:hypothetical protein [Nucisporomicrobium flavum]|jgi:hypothetical protein|uniref:hypothetical protein n=1 Tax=Nucisporomicrobium flavum TaxID=2785915 RepID=UPI0018F69864|nr:hypothetical protein [Nucisporomicrobium flavum]